MISDRAKVDRMMRVAAEAARRALEAACEADDEPDILTMYAVAMGLVAAAAATVNEIDEALPHRQTRDCRAEFVAAVGKVWDDINGLGKQRVQ